MKPFRTNLKLVINNYLCSVHKSFPEVDSSSNDVMLSENSKYICSYNFNSISFDSLFMFLNYKYRCNLDAFVNLVLFNRCILFWVIYWIFKKIALDVCHVLPLVYMRMLSKIKGNSNFIRKFSYWFRNHNLL